MGGQGILYRKIKKENLKKEKLNTSSKQNTKKQRNQNDEVVVCVALLFALFGPMVKKKNLLTQPSKTLSQ